MHKIAILLLPLLLAVPAAAADETVNADARAKAVAPYLDDQVFAVAHVDVSRFKVETALAKLAELGKLDAAEIQPLKKKLLSWLGGFTRAKGKEVYFVFSLADIGLDANSVTPFVLVPVEEGADARALARLLSLAGFTSEKLSTGPMVVGGSRKALRRLRRLKPAARPELAKAFAAAGDTAIQLLILPTADMRRVVAETLPNLPAELGGGSGKALSRGLHWAALGLDPPPQMSLKLIIQSKDEAAAKALRALIVQFLQAVGKWDDVRDAFPSFDKLAASITPKVVGDQLAVTHKGDNLARGVGELTQWVQEMVRRAKVSEHLSKLGLALHKYHDAHNEFPAAASYDKDGKALLSWRVHVLPYVGHEKLYKEFHLDEPWDSTHNLKLVKRMPAVFHSGNYPLTREGKTTILAPTGKGTMFPGHKRLKMGDISDGTSNTILLVEALPVQAVVWTRPDDLPYDSNKPFAGLVDRKKKSFLGVAADGTVHCLPASMKAKTLIGLFSPAGGEQVRFPGCAN
jgi:hypothetical protein